MERKPCGRCKKYAAFGLATLCIPCGAEVAASPAHAWNHGREPVAEDHDLSDRCIPESGDWPSGVVVETTPITPAANVVFTPAELEERIAAHRARVLREYPQSQRSRNGQGL